MIDALIIDDYTPTAKAMESLLEKFLPGDWKIGISTDALAAQAILAAEPRLKLVVLDYFLPRMDGQAIATTAIKIRPRLRGRIIICSGAEFPEDIEQDLFVDLECKKLPKPVDIELLNRYVTEILAMP